MDKFRLKKEARHFFNKDMATQIGDLDFWESQCIHELLLERVERNVYVELGKITGTNSKSISGWNPNYGEPKSHFYFTVHISEMEDKEYNSVNLAEVMDKIQSVLNEHFKQ